jgi:hypothetical protein
MDLTPTQFHFNIKQKKTEKLLELLTDLTSGYNARKRIYICFVICGGFWGAVSW